MLFKDRNENRALSQVTIAQKCIIYPGAYGLLIYPILSISHQQLFPLLLYMRLFTAPVGKKYLLLLFFGASSGTGKTDIHFTTCYFAT